MRNQDVVRLPEEERASLLTMIGRGTAPARVQTHARILLKANRGEAGPEWTDGAISTALEVAPTTVARVRKLYVTDGVETALHRKAPDRVYRRKLDGEQEARLVAVAAWVAKRNADVRTIDWRFTTDDARIKLDHLYPVLHD